MKNKLILIALVTALSACGGGGGGDDATASSRSQPAPIVAAPGDMTKYAGTWTSTCIVEGQGSARMTLILGVNDKSATGRLVTDGYNGSVCGGQSAQLSIPFSATYVEMVGAAEKLAVAESGGTSTMLATFSADGRALTIYDGADTFTFTKQ
ncbi:hypothetical protein ACFQUU_08890 [Herbaspirillum sp. GCM10030257]|uniref:hypothetical protein n=1 Tax=Herbaspirillum sp. GCM10030257 TaxID=3273393 RepID=UPI00361F7AE4